MRVLARFKVNKLDCVSVFKATTKEDFKDVVKLLPENTPLPASNKMTCVSPPEYPAFPGYEATRTVLMHVLLSGQCS